MNHTTLAKRLDVSRPYVIKVLHGDVNISFGTALRFAKALEMDFVPQLVAQNIMLAPQVSKPCAGAVVKDVKVKRLGDE